MKTVLFDLDGTLLDTLDDIVSATNHVLRATGYPERSREELIPMIGASGRNLVRRALPIGAQDDLERVLAVYRAYYTPDHMPCVKPYDGIADAVRTLTEEGYAIGVVSNKSDDNVRHLVSRFFPQIKVTVGVTPDRPIKPDPAMCRLALEQLGGDVRSCVYVGDTEVDLETARALGVPCIGLSWGFRGRTLLQSLGADPIVDTADELVRTVRALLGAAKEQ